MSTYRLLTNTKPTRRSPLSAKARTAFVISALLAELNGVRRDTSDPELMRDLKQAEKHLCRAYDRLGNDIPMEFLANKAGHMAIKAMFYDSTEVRVNVC